MAGSRYRRIESFTAFFGLVAMVGFVFRDPIVDILRNATTSPGKAYVLLVPVLASYLVWLRRSRLRQYSYGTSFTGLVFILGGWLLFICGAFYDVVVFWHLGGVVAFIGVIVTFTGPRVILLFSPAFLVLLAFAPLPGSVREAIALPLQRLATGVTAVILELFGVDAIRRGNIIEINGKIVLVGEACNGMRLVMPIALVMYGVVFSIPLRRAARFFLLASSVPVALFCNVLRLIPTSLAYGFAPRGAEVIHEIGGWLMLPIAVLLLLGLLRFVEWLDVSVSKWRLVTA
ncbi:exosortase/archaeosortase family protein [bacterium]|nr:exosortase/archaeosortase family protein [bacterium]